MTIDDLKLELIALQNRDMEDAINNGINNKDLWLKHMMESEEDEVAEGILDLAKRYELDDNVVAYYFDPTMLIRLSKVKNRMKEKLTI